MSYNMPTATPLESPSFETLGGRMRIARENNGLTIQQAAHRLNTIHSVLRQIEKGQRQPTQQLISRAATLYNAAAHWLTNGNQETS